VNTQEQDTMPVKDLEITIAVSPADIDAIVAMINRDRAPCNHITAQQFRKNENLKTPYVWLTELSQDDPLELDMTFSVRLP